MNNFFRCRLTDYVTPTVSIRDNTFSTNEDWSADLTFQDCVEASILNNTFNDNNAYRHKGTLHVKMSPSANLENHRFKLTLERNTFSKNQGELSAHFETSNMNTFNATIAENHFYENENRRTVLLFDSPRLTFVNNWLDNKVC